MKTKFIITLGLVLFAYSTFAQHAERTELIRRLTRDEVPVVVVLALQKDFIKIADNGTWKLIYQEDLNTTKLIPEFYEYTFKQNGERVQIFYKPDGTLDHTKGITAPATHPSEP